VETAVLLRRIFLAVGAVMMVIGAIVLIGAFPEYGSTSTVGAICGTMLLVGGVLMLPLAVIVGLLGKESDGE
jgi:hypothetical protein